MTGKRQDRREEFPPKLRQASGSRDLKGQIACTWLTGTQNALDQKDRGEESRPLYLGSRPGSKRRLDGATPTRKAISSKKKTEEKKKRMMGWRDHGGGGGGSAASASRRDVINGRGRGGRVGVH